MPRRAPGHFANRHDVLLRQFTRRQSFRIRSFVTSIVSSTALTGLYSSSILSVIFVGCFHGGDRSAATPKYCKPGSVREDGTRVLMLGAKLLRERLRQRF
jgi:hypothetical protein